MKSKTLSILIFFAIPLTISLSLIVSYFSEIPWLQEIISPDIEGINPDSNREFGLLENLQNLYLIIIIFILAFGFKKKHHRFEKTFIKVCLFLTLFVFLEEIDYGLHIYEYLYKVDIENVTKIRNIHNIDRATMDKNIIVPLLKRLVDAGIALFFVIFPLIAYKFRNLYIKFLAPNKWSILTVLVMVIQSELAHWLEDLGFDKKGTLHTNISEFRELTVYYLAMLYLMEIVHFRKWHASA